MPMVATMKPYTLFVVDDDIGQIEVVWETGLTLRLVPEEDKFHIDHTPEPDMFEEQEAAEEEL